MTRTLKIIGDTARIRAVWFDTEADLVEEIQSGRTDADADGASYVAGGVVYERDSTVTGGDSVLSGFGLDGWKFGTLGSQGPAGPSDRADHTGVQDIDTISGLQATLDEKAPTDDPAFDASRSMTPLRVKSQDGYDLLTVEENGNATLAGGNYSIDPFSTFRVMTSDGHAVLDFCAETGGIKGAISPSRFILGGGLSLADGEPCAGVVTGVHSAGEWFGYSLNSQDYTGPVVGRIKGDWTAPHMVDAPVLEVLEADGQSWQTIQDYTADEIDFEETSGETSAAIRLAATPMVSILRKNNRDGVTVEDGERTSALDTISNGTLPGDLHKFDPKYGFSTSQITAVARSRFQRRMGLPSNPAIVLNVGWPGTSSEKFLPEGSSYNYTDDDGAAQTTTAVSHPSAGAYLWDRNIDRRAALRDTIDSAWFRRALDYSYLTWIQGPFEDGGNTLGFLQEYRAQQDALLIDGTTRSRNIFWDQSGGLTSRTLTLQGTQAQLEFCQTNASGKDWLVGPRSNHYMRDDIHHSSFGALEYAERTAQAMAYVQKYGTWEPLWINGVSFTGSDCVLTINDPRQCDGGLFADNDAISPAPNHGFTLWDVTSDTEIPITSLNISGDQITLQTAGNLSGDIEVGYAARSPSTRPDGTVQNPEHSAVWGNIKRKGRDAPAIIPSLVQPTLDHWLCTYRKTFTV